MMQVQRDDGGAGNRRCSIQCLCLCQGPSPMFVRYIYVALFFLANILAWLERENPKMFFEWQRHSGCKGERDCHAAEAVLILFFLSMFFSIVYARKIQDRRNSWHSGWWPIKIVLLASLIAMSILAPSYWMQLYGKAAHFGAGVFLFIQLMSLIRCITRLNHSWCVTNYENRNREVIAVSVVTHIGFTVGIILMCFWYAGCWLNIAFIGTTLLLVYLMYLISLNSETNGFYMEPGIVGAYIVFLCYLAIKSEPETDCYKKGKAGSGVDWKTIVSFVGELISITVAAFSTGIDYKCIQFRNAVESEDDVPYGYGFLHFVLAMGSMYFGMLFVGWDTHHTMEKWNMDVGWTSTWVHIVNEGVAVISFVAILVARINGIAWLRQLLERIFGIGEQQQQQQMVMLRRSRSDSNEESSAGLAAPPSSPVSQTREDMDTPSSARRQTIIEQLHQERCDGETATTAAAAAAAGSSSSPEIVPAEDEDTPTKLRDGRIDQAAPTAAYELYMYICK